MRTEVREREMICEVDTGDIFEIGNDFYILIKSLEEGNYYFKNLNGKTWTGAKGDTPKEAYERSLKLGYNIKHYPQDKYKLVIEEI